jgi:hypothetical protein
MAIKIVDADLNYILKARRAGRARSPETQMMLDSISELRPGQAKAIVLENRETIPAVRSRLAYAARVAGVKLRVATNRDRIMFALRRGGPASGADREGAAARRESVQQAALGMGGSRKTPLSAENVLAVLSKNGIVFEMSRPGTMVGAILRSMPEFERVGRNQFRYIGQVPGNFADVSVTRPGSSAAISPATKSPG